MRNRSKIAAAFVLVALTAAPLLHAEPATEVDKIFVEHVSQGGMYEVEASKIAEKRATAPDVKDLASTEVHDHDGVNERLKKIAEAAGLHIGAELIPEFKERLAKLRDKSEAEFDAAYVQDMKQIHDKDEKLFAKEAKEGSGEFRAFAHNTDQIVKRHIGALHGTD